jgi:hypothetical protein
MSKKLQLGTPLRREYTVSDTEWIEDLAVENTKALAFCSTNSKFDLIIQGRLNNGQWHFITPVVDEVNLARADISQWERVRFRHNGSDFNNYSLVVTAFDPIQFYSSIVTEATPRDFHTNNNILDTLKIMCLELQKLNVYMNLITEDNVTESDVEGNK